MNFVHVVVTTISLSSSQLERYELVTNQWVIGNKKYRYYAVQKIFTLYIEVIELTWLKNLISIHSMGGVSVFYA